MTGVTIKVENLEIDTHPVRTSCKHKEGDVQGKERSLEQILPSQGCEGTIPASALV